MGRKEEMVRVAGFEPADQHTPAYRSKENLGKTTILSAPASWSKLHWSRHWSGLRFKFCFELLPEFEDGSRAHVERNRLLRGVSLRFCSTNFVSASNAF
jgi:hypothetical protein